MKWCTDFYLFDVYFLGGVNVGGFDFNLQFNWHAIPEREKKRHKVSFNFQKAML